MSNQLAVTYAHWALPQKRRLPQCLAGLGGLALLVLGSGAYAAPKTPAASAAATVVAFQSAIVKGDEAAASMLLAPDVLIYETGGQESSRDEYAAHHMKGDMAFLAGSKHETLSRAEGGDDRLAWVSTRSRIRTRYKDKDLDIFSTESVVLRNTPAGWRIVHIHWSSRPVTQNP